MNDKGIKYKIVYKGVTGDEDITHLVEEFHKDPIIDGVNCSRVSDGWYMVPPKNITLKFYDGRKTSFSHQEIDITIYMEDEV